MNKESDSLRILKEIYGIKNKKKPDEKRDELSTLIDDVFCVINKVPEEESLSKRRLLYRHKNLKKFFDTATEKDFEFLEFSLNNLRSVARTIININRSKF